MDWAIVRDRSQDCVGFSGPTYKRVADATLLARCASTFYKYTYRHPERQAKGMPQNVAIVYKSAYSIGYNTPDPGGAIELPSKAVADPEVC